MMRRTAAFSIFITLVDTQAQADIPTISTTPFVEKVYENSEISGALVVGLSQIAGTMTDVLRITANVPAHWDSLCLSVSTVDGLYEARNEYQLPEGWSGGEVVFDYPTAHAAKLLQAGPDRIGTLVHRGACHAATADLALSGWRVSEADSEAFRLYVNSFQADEVVVYVGNGPEVPCSELRDGSRAAFDMVCDLKLEAGATSPVDIELIRIRSGRVEAASPIRLEW